MREVNKNEVEWNRVRKRMKGGEGDAEKGVRVNQGGSEGRL